MARISGRVRIVVRIALLVVLLMLTFVLWTASEQKRLPSTDGKPWIPETGVLKGSEGDWLYRARKLQKDAISAGNPRVIFLGDSLTEGWRFHGRKVWDEYYGERRAVNLGIWGDRTQHLLWRLTEYPIDDLDPEVVVLLIGINNVWFNPPEEVVLGVKTVVRTVRGQLPEARILLMGLLPALADPRHRPPAIERVNELLEEWAHDSPADVTFLDISEAFLNESGYIEYGNLIDAVHLSSQGYRVWAESMEPTLAGLLEPAGSPNGGLSNPEQISPLEEIPNAGNDQATTRSVAIR